MVDFFIGSAAFIAGIAFLFALWRFVIGPTRLDRVVAFDVLTIILSLLHCLKIVLCILMWRLFMPCFPF